MDLRAAISLEQMPRAGGVQSFALQITPASLPTYDVDAPNSGTVEVENDPSHL